MAVGEQNSLGGGGGEESARMFKTKYYQMDKKRSTQNFSPFFS